MNQNKIKIEFNDNEITLDKKLSTIDDLVLDFSEILTRNNIRYALFSRYVPILFGSNETNEEKEELKDIDILTQNISFEKFLKLWLEIERSYECKNTSDPIDAYNAYLKNHHAVRIVKKDSQIPEFRIKIVKNEMDRFTLKYRKKVILGDRNLFISPLEMQISYNLFKGSPKDIGDARYLYKLSGAKLNITMMERFFGELKIPRESIDTYLKI
ncbi:MAG: hypothetical protein FIB07_01285 [Candidatus Methanoperedens sp.]|nr:hypothetical protein [Candidatus Methanoperedens sp.]